MIRFLQKPGPIKKIVLGGILLVVCVMMVITLIPGGGFLNDMFGGSLTTQGVVARVGDQEIEHTGGGATGPPHRQAAVQGQCSSRPHAVPDAAGGAGHDRAEGAGVRGRPHGLGCEQ